MTALVGKGERNPISGTVRLRDADQFADFTVVDLWSRCRVSGTLEELARDPYLFRPVPLAYRTWIYHSESINHGIAFEKDENSMLKQVLGHHCIDAPVSGGRWSPVMSLAPLALVASLTNDAVVIIPALVMVAIGHALALQLNTARGYQHVRPMTLVPRLALYLLMTARFVMALTRARGAGGLAILGYLLALGVVLQDIIGGDVAMLRAYRLHCSYEITHLLPKRLYICLRKGASQLEEMFGSRGCVAECISGFGQWERTHTLIADVQGLIVELRPMQQEDWERVYEQNVVDGQAVSFLAYDIFSDALPTAADLLRERDMPRRKAGVEPPGSPRGELLQ